MFLGIHYGHDASICVIDENNQILAYSLLERVDGIRHSGGGYTSSQLKKFFRDNNINPQKIRAAGVTSGQHLELVFPPKSAFSFKYKTNCIDSNLDKWFDSHGTQLPQSSFLGDRISRGEDVGVLEKYFPNYCKDIKTCREDKNKSDFSSVPYLVNHYDIVRQINRTNGSRPEFGMILPGELTLLPFGLTIPAFFVDHHLAHGFSAYYKSPYEECMIFSADGGGAGGNGNLFSIAKPKIGVVPLTSTNFSGGQLYTHAAKIIGLDPGKFMGLSAYGTPDKNFISSTIANITTVKYLESENLSSIVVAGYEQKHGIDLASFSPSTLCTSSEELWDNQFGTMCDIRANFAATIQNLYEEWLLWIIKSCITTHSLGRLPLVLSGGCALNCPANQRVSEYIEKNLYIETSCNDEGLGFGAATAVSKIAYDTAFPSPTARNHNRSPYQCSNTSNEETAILHALRLGFIIETGIDWSAIAQRVAKGEIGFLCRGKAELGPRALGNRSIISSASRRLYHAEINRIKGRELWRPLAPAALKESFQDYFEGQPNEYMLMTNKVITNRLPAVTHFDKSARVQAVDKDQSNFYQLLMELKKLIPEDEPVAIVNTSLNGPGEPILDDLISVINLMQKSSANFVVTDNFTVSKEAQS